MTTLMTDSGPCRPDAAVTRSGGVPLVPAGWEWQLCRTCGGPMAFLAQVVRPGSVVAAFQCDNDPGMCEEWDPAEGGNAVFVFTGPGLTPARVPPTGVTALPEVHGVALRDLPGVSYYDARVAERSGVLGQLGGTPQWNQDDEVPDCPACAEPMGFVAQWEVVTGANFAGDGSGYVFACDHCATGAMVAQS